MKKHLLPLFSTTALALGLAGCASPSGEQLAASNTLVVNQPIELVLPAPVDEITTEFLTQMTVSTPVGSMDKDAVMQRLGRPTERLTPDVWVYWQYCSPEQLEANGGHDTLVVVFKPDEKVAGMKFVEGEALKKHLAGPRYRMARAGL